MIAVNYTIFAIIATIVNIGTQELSIRLYDQAYAVPLSVFLGTGTGLVAKYLLDKKYIFKYTTQSIGHDAKLFYLYTVMGLITTVIFWGMEFGFDYLFDTRLMRYVGGVIGLAIGYVLKYHLDKKFVFKTETA